QALVVPPLWALLGWIIGVWLDRLIHQLPAGRPLKEAPSCFACGEPISVVRVRGPGGCPRCGADLHYDRVEWLLGVLFLALAIHFGADGRLLIYSVDTIMLIVLSAIDLRHRFVYAIVVYPALLLALVLTPLLTETNLLTTLVG